MEHNRKTKMITIVALIVAVLGLSVGLSAYSKTLNIQNVQASVAGNPSNFDVEFSTSSASATNGSVNGSHYESAPSGDGGTATLRDTTISNLTATFKPPGGAVAYDFYVYNNGSIPAYLTDITYDDTTCIPASGTSNELVQAICEHIYIEIYIKNSKNSRYNLQGDGTTKITDSEVINPKSAIPIQVILMYGYSSIVPDGNFTVKFGDVTLNYSSQKPSV